MSHPSEATIVAILASGDFARLDEMFANVVEVFKALGLEPKLRRMARKNSNWADAEDLFQKMWEESLTRLSDQLAGRPVNHGYTGDLESYLVGCMYWLRLSATRDGFREKARDVAYDDAEDFRVAASNPGAALMFSDAFSTLTAREFVVVSLRHELVSPVSVTDIRQLVETTDMPAADRDALMENAAEILGERSVEAVSVGEIATLFGVTDGFIRQILRSATSKMRGNVDLPVAAE